MSGRPVDVVLHIGTDKTGTTSLQQLLRLNRAALLEHGVLYPRSPGRVRHVELGLYARSDEALLKARDWLRGDHPSPDVFRRRLRRRLTREITESGASRVVLSDEALFRLQSDFIERLRDLTNGSASLRIVVYLRRQDEHLVSSYQQAVKVGETRRLDEWARQIFPRRYDYAARLRDWQSALEPEKVVVRPFERERFPGGSLAQDFLDAAGVAVPVDRLRPVAARNESLGAEAVELLRILNLHQVEHHGLQPWQISNRPHVSRLRIGGPSLTLPDADLDRYLDQWGDSNRAVAREHLGDPDGILFRSARRTGSTTTEQRLDPTRLDHYLPLLEVPEEDHAAIRRIAEREATDLAN